MAASPSTTVIDVQFEHYRPGEAIGVQESRPRISWRFSQTPAGFEQEEYEIRLRKYGGSQWNEVHAAKVTSSESHLVPWPHDQPIASREKYSVDVRARPKGLEHFTPWSEPATIEAGLLERGDWTAKVISAPWAEENSDKPQPEDLFRKGFSAGGEITSARLYITSQGVYEAEINGQRVGDHFLAPGWTAYAGRLQYQTYDVTSLLSSGGDNCIGVRIAEGWFKGRMGFMGGRRNLWGTRTTLLAQLEIRHSDGTATVVTTDDEWTVTRGPIQSAEIYDGEKYDATQEIPGWSKAGSPSGSWQNVDVLEDLPEETQLIASFSEPVRRVEVLKPRAKITTPSGKTILDFGQNLVGYLRIKNVKGSRGHIITLSHAEVLEKEELGVRPLRVCKAQDTYTLRGDENGESYEPRFTFHGFRYAQIDNWPSAEIDLLDVIEAVVCHTDMEEAGTFSSSDELVNKLFNNIRWGMKGNFLSVPTDCPQRDERMGWTGDLALFAPTATYLYGCFGILKNWLRDVELDQKKLGGVPPLVTPNVLLGDPFWGQPIPMAIWHDVTILAPWILFEETGDASILKDQYNSMTTWLSTIPKNQTTSTHLWNFEMFQLADWLDPNAPPSEPHKALTDPLLVANAFLIQSLDLITKIADTLGLEADTEKYRAEAAAARQEFVEEYVSSNGRVSSETQTAYAVAICFGLLNEKQTRRAGERLAELVRRNSFKIGTGFAGTPFVCEALARTGRSDVAYAMLLNKTCPSWMYPITMGATTMWERWDSMLPDGSINSGEMTSFNHYAFGAIGKFLVERIAGLQRLEPGWEKSRVQPELGGEFTWAKAEHKTPYGLVSSSWALTPVEGSETSFNLEVKVIVPPTTQMEVVLPGPDGLKTETVGSGEWTFTTQWDRKYEWPVKEIASFPM